MKIILDKERPMSWNTLYAGNHWSIRKEEAERVHALVHFSLKAQNIRPQGKFFEVPVDIVIAAYFKNRPLDADNICAKFYIDGLKEIVIKDDSPLYVSSVQTKSLIDSKRPRVEISIEVAT